MNGWMKMDLAIGGHGFRIVALIRLFPLIPFNVLNYALGRLTPRVGSLFQAFLGWRR